MVKSNDCLNLIRLLAAFGVMYRHIIRHLSIDIPDYISYLLFWLPGVPLFFCLSGFLIWPSIGRSRTFVEYFKKRFWRIYPELWGAVIVNSIVILFLFDKPIQWFNFLLFNITQSTFFQFWTPDFLRDYGCGTPNGALWTICVIFQFYILGFFLYKIVYKKNLLQLSLLIIFGMVAYMHSHIVSLMPFVIGKLYGQTVIPYLWLFLLGVFICDNKDCIISLLKNKWWLFLIPAFFLKFFSFDIALINYGLFYSVLSFLGFVGFAYKFPKLNLGTDVSYAVYVYHMVVVNVFVALGFTSNIIYLLVVIAITLVLSFISTKTIGAFGLKKKKCTN